MKLSRVGKQLVGAAIGMTLATVLYMGLEQMSLTSSGMKAYLVSPGQNIAESAGEVRVNDTTADSTTIGRLTRFASTVATQLKTKDSTSTSLDTRVQARKEARMVDAGQISALANAVEYPNVVTEVTQRERLALRAARAVVDHAGAPVYVPNPNVVEVPASVTKASETKDFKDFKGFKPVEMVTPPQVLPPVQSVPAPVPPAPAPAPVQVSPTTITPIVTNPVPVPVVTVTPPTVPAPPVIAPPVVSQKPPSKDLPDSGLGLNLLIALSLLTSLGIVRPDLPRRVIASLRHSS
jgi:hypothetical protein